MDESNGRRTSTLLRERTALIPRRSSARSLCAGTSRPIARFTVVRSCDDAIAADLSATRDRYHVDSTWFHVKARGRQRKGGDARGMIGGSARESGP